jgi:hypothetical protein
MEVHKAATLASEILRGSVIYKYIALSGSERESNGSCNCVVPFKHIRS